MFAKPLYWSAGWLLIAALALLGAVAGILGFRMLMGFGVTFYSSYEKVDVGMSETEVVALLGLADEKSTQFRLGQRDGFEQEYARAARSGSAHYLLWHKGIDVVYAVGFDGEGKVTMKAVGGT